MSTDNIGRGLLYPLRREHGDFSNGTGADLLRSNCRKIINTRAFTPSGASAGEYRWRRNFGSLVNLLRHSNMFNVQGDFAILYCAEAVFRWEPRAQVNTELCSVTKDTRDSRLKRVRIYLGLREHLGGDVRLGAMKLQPLEITV